MDVYLCVCMKVRERKEGGEHREKEVCEGTIRALYYKSLTVHVCGDNGGMSLSILALSE